jgi:serpin B
MKRLAVLCCLALRTPKKMGTRLLSCRVPIFLGVLSLSIPAWAAGPAERAVPADVRTLVQGNNAFALDLYARLRAREGNLFCSPYSISTALAMSSAGARGETAVQMARVLHFGLDSSRLHPAFTELIRGLNGYGLPCDYQLSVAQSLWGDARLSVREDFQKLIHTYYGARLRQREFQLFPDEARQQINRWVEERTNDKIKELLHPGDIDPKTRMVLVNAIYFKAGWQEPFQEAETERNAVFHAVAKDVNTDLMQQMKRLSYAEGEGLQVLELPYEGRELAMVVLLPRQKDGLGNLERSLTVAKLDSCLDKLAPEVVEVGLPRFRFEARFDLAQELRALGMSLAFNPGADFSGISTAEKLFISKVIHQAFVDVTEGGTEAAAATASLFRAPPGPGGGGGGGPRVVFRADHPFLFLLRDQRTGSILFLGRVTDPLAISGPGRPVKQRPVNERIEPPPG